LASYQSYVICTCPRSGSTLLCRLLAATGTAGNPDSYFHSPSLNDWWDDLALPPTRPQSEVEMLGTIFAAAREQGTTNTGIFGLRLQRHSFDFFIEKTGVLFPGLSSDAERFEAAFGATLFIYLTRENKLEQAISYVKASQTGLWHQAPDGTELERLSAPQEPVYDGGKIAQHLNELTALDEGWRDWFTQESINAMRITYEELSADPTTVLATILEQLGLDAATAKGIDPGVAKLADAISRNWAERFLAEQVTG